MSTAGDRGGDAPSMSVHEVTLTFRFKTVFVTVVALTVVSLVLSVGLFVAMALIDLSDNPRAATALDRLLQVFTMSWQTGFAGLVGLVGGKSL